MIWNRIFGAGHENVQFHGTLTHAQHRQEFRLDGRRPPEPWHIVTLGLKPFDPALFTHEILTIEYAGNFLRGLPKRADTIAGTGTWTDYHVIRPDSLTITATGEIVAASAAPIKVTPKMLSIELRGLASSAANQKVIVQLGIRTVVAVVDRVGVRVVVALGAVDHPVQQPVIRAINIVRNSHLEVPFLGI